MKSKKIRAVFEFVNRPSFETVFELEISKVKIGNLIHLKFENDNLIAVSWTEKSGFKPAIIHMLYGTPAQKQRDPEVRITVIDHDLYLDLLNGWSFWSPNAIIDATGNILSTDDITNFTRKEIFKHKINKLNADGFIYKTKLGRIMAVARRIVFCKMCNEKIEKIRAEKLTYYDKNVKYPEELLKEYFLTLDLEPLLLYLLLTCFDILGQQEEFLTFEDWLPKVKFSEYPGFLPITSQDSFRTIISRLTETYRDAYALKRNFTKYILEGLPDENREQLLNSIKIGRREYFPADTNIRVYENDNSPENKVQFLFGIRNQFTHGGIEPLASSFLRIVRDQNTFLPSEYRRDWLTIDQKRKKGVDYSYNVKGWPEVLLKTVQSGLIKLINEV